MKILLLSAYHAASHRRWAQGLKAHLPQHEFEILTQPPRHFAWRSRGNSLYWAFDDRVAQARHDLVVATSMVALASLRGMAPHLAQIPTIAYFHENQFAYPNRGDRNDGNYKATNLYTALAADRVLFNSRYNRQTFLSGVDTFLDRMPDQIPPGVRETIAEHSAVLPVPLEDRLFEQANDQPTDRQKSGPLRLVWNHRWEYDKAPDRFADALENLTDRFDFRLVIMGQRFRNAPEAFSRIRKRFDDRIEQWGWVEDRDDYLSLLRRSDLVISTALHEFQGLAIQEATVCGCRPVLPDRLAYPDFFDAKYLYESHRDSASTDATSLADHLAPLLADPERTRAQKRPDLGELRWSNLAPQYDEEFQALVARMT